MFARVSRLETTPVFPVLIIYPVFYPKFDLGFSPGGGGEIPNVVGSTGPTTGLPVHLGQAKYQTS